MKYLIILYILLCTTSYVKCQEIQVFSADEKEIVFPATIFFMINDSIVGGTPTDEQGKAILQLDKEVNFIELHSFGYQPKKIHRKDILPQIYLEDIFVELQEITISGTKKNLKRKTKNLGYPLKRRNHSVCVSAVLEMVTLIENKLQKEKKVKSFLFRINSDGEDLRLIKVLLYANENGKIGKQLLKNNQFLTLTLKPNQKKVKLDITYLDIKIPKEGFFAGIEYVGCIDEKTNKKISASKKREYHHTDIPLLKTKNKKATTYARDKFNIYLKDWTDINDKKLSLSELLKENQYFVPAFGIEVYE